MIEMVKKIALREDIGWLLGEGSRNAAAQIGGLAPEFAVHVKGMEFAAHDPRCKFSNALAYAVSERGACHLSAFSYPFENGGSMADLGYPRTLDRFTSEGKGEFVAKFQDLMSMFDSLITCKFSTLGLTDQTVATLTGWLNNVTGWSLTMNEFLETGERIMNIKRLYNCRCGVSRKDDTLPPRILSFSRPDGDSAGQLANFGKMLDDYYKIRGWDELGIPTADTLARLGLSKV
jgi:aldehyde:ferredoxin oxidoreductase